MYKPILTALALLGVGSAQITTELWLGGFGDSLVGSVVGSDATATTYSINCADPDSDFCAVPPSFTFTQGPSTINYAYSASEDGVGEETIMFGCVITNSLSGVCSGTLTASAPSTSTSTATTISFSNARAELEAQVVTITAGAIPSAPNSALSTTSSVSSAKESSTSSTKSSASLTGTAAAGSTSSSVSSGGGVNVINGNAPRAIGFAAAALAFAAM